MIIFENDSWSVASRALYEFRCDRRLFAVDVASDLGISVFQLMAVENGRAMPSVALRCMLEQYTEGRAKFNDWSRPARSAA